MKKTKDLPERRENIFLSLKVFNRFIFSDECKFITGIKRLPLYNDEPKIFSYIAEYKTRDKHNKDVASGFSFNKERALTRVLGEVIERYCLDNYKGKHLLIGSCEELGKGKIDLGEVVSFSSAQLKNPDFKQFRLNRESRFGWIEGMVLPSNQRVLIPAQLASFNYNKLKNEPTILMPLSTGAAAGISLDGAIYRGICEIVERDAFLIHYLNKLPSPKIDLGLIQNQDEEIHKILKIFKRYKLELTVVDITTDLQIPAFAAVTLDRTGLGPSVSVGLKAGFHIKDSIIGAIEESLMARSWIRDKFVYLSPHYKRSKIIKSFEDRSHFWFLVKSIKHLNFWIKSKNIQNNIQLKHVGGEPDKLEKSLKILKKQNMDVIYVNITSDAIKKWGIFVAKVIIPQLQPLYLDEKYPYLGGDRLYRVPVQLGFQKRRKQESQLNKIPHPFL